MNTQILTVTDLIRHLHTTRQAIEEELQCCCIFEAHLEWLGDSIVIEAHVWDSEHKTNASRNRLDQRKCASLSYEELSTENIQELLNDFDSFFASIPGPEDRRRARIAADLKDAAGTLDLESNEEGIKDSIEGEAYKALAAQIRKQADRISSNAIQDLSSFDAPSFDAPSFDAQDTQANKKENSQDG